MASQYWNNISRQDIANSQYCQRKPNIEPMWLDKRTPTPISPMENQHWANIFMLSGLLPLTFSLKTKRWLFRWFMNDNGDQILNESKASEAFSRRGCTLLNWSHLIFSTALWLENLLVYSYLLLSQERNQSFSFYILYFSAKGVFYMLSL